MTDKLKKLSDILEEFGCTEKDNDDYKTWLDLTILEGIPNKAIALDFISEAILTKTLGVISKSGEQIRLPLDVVQKLISGASTIEVTKQKNGDLDKGIKDLFFYNLAKKVGEKGEKVVIEITNDGRDAISKFKNLINRFYGGARKITPSA